MNSIAYGNIIGETSVKLAIYGVNISLTNDKSSVCYTRNIRTNDKSNKR